MPSAVGIRTDFSAAELRRLAASSKHANQSRRLLSLAAVLDGMSREEAARIGGMDRQTLRDWVHRFNAEGPDGLKDIRSKGHPPRLAPDQLTALAEIAETGPDRAKDGVVRWRRVDLKRVIEERFGVVYHERTIGKLLKQLGFSHISARPRHPGQKAETIAAFKKNFAATLTAHLAHIPKRKPIEIWFQDEARIGQKNGLVRQWARRGTRPRQPADQRYESAYLFGAICPARGVGAALAMPFADTQAMQAHLGEIGSTVARGAHAVLLLDRAGWHTTEKLTIPKNLTLILLPSRSPELNPVENIWQFLRANWLSNRVFETYDEIIGAACEAWNKLTALPAAITSIGMQDWAHIGRS
ncbi:MAG: IS630 family transposase [Burkholderiales bacterium]